MKRARRRILITIALLALIVLNVYVMAFHKAPADDTGIGSNSQSLLKDSGAGTSLDRSSEIPEIYNDTEGPVPQDDGKG